MLGAASNGRGRSAVMVATDHGMGAAPTNLNLMRRDPYFPIYVLQVTNIRAAPRPAHCRRSRARRLSGGRQSERTIVCTVWYFFFAG